MRYLISYDLTNADEDDYKVLHDELKRIGAKRVLRSQWAVSMNDTSTKKLTDHLKNFINKDDRLLVTTIVAFSGWNLIFRISKL